MNAIHVVAGALEDQQGRILIARRPDGRHQGGIWEFPGGKIERGESPGQGLARELEEELGIQVLASRPLIRVHHHYADRHILLDVHRVTTYRGEPRGREGQPLAWLAPQEMDPAVFPAADRPIISALRLPSLYLITGEDPARPEEFLERLNRVLGSGVRLVQLRAHGLGELAYARLAQAAWALCEQQGARLLLNRAPELAEGLAGHGLHLRGQQLTALRERPPDWPLVGASCHSGADLERAAELGLDYALLSPVLATASHPASPFLGWAGFASLVEAARLPVFALGGLRRQDLDQAVAVGAQGIAMISGLWGDSVLDT